MSLQHQVAIETKSASGFSAAISGSYVVDGTKVALAEITGE